jgi:hypothetical protein
MPDEHPRRRISDRGQAQAIDMLNQRLNRQGQRLEELEDQLIALRLLPQRVTEIREDQRDMLRRMNARFDRTDHAHTELRQKTETVVAQTSGTNWKEFFTYLIGAMAGVGIPIAIAFLAGAS